MTVSRVLWISCLLIGSIICVPVEYGMITLTKLRKLNKIKWPWIHSGSCLVSPQIMDLIWNMTIWAHTPCRREHFFMTIPKTVQIMRQTTAMPTSPQTPVLVLVVTGVTRWLGMTGSLVAIQGGTVFTLIPAVRKTSLFLVTCLVWNQSTLLALVHATKEEEQCLPKPATPPQSLLAYLCRYSHTPATHFLDMQSSNSSQSCLLTLGEFSYSWLLIWVVWMITGWLTCLLFSILRSVNDSLPSCQNT